MRVPRFDPAWIAAGHLGLHEKRGAQAGGWNRRPVLDETRPSSDARR